MTADTPAFPQDGDECGTCGEFGDRRRGECPNGQRPCLHHCNCVWIHDSCHWCPAHVNDDGRFVAMDNTSIARVIHGAVRELQALNNEEVSPIWDDAPEWMRESTIQGVEGALSGNSPEESHEAWMETRLADGWTLGPVKNVDAKISPCLVPYDDLPPLQRAKDHVFGAIVNALKDIE